LRNPADARLSVERGTSTGGRTSTGVRRIINYIVRLETNTSRVHFQYTQSPPHPSDPPTPTPKHIYAPKTHLHTHIYLMSSNDIGRRRRVRRRNTLRRSRRKCHRSDITILHGKGSKSGDEKIHGFLPFVKLHEYKV